MVTAPTLADTMPLSDPNVPSYKSLISQTQVFVKSYMSQPHFDASHDYSHILRVLALSQHLLSVEKASHPSIPYDETIVTLSALLHDIADHKYHPPPSTTSLSPPPNHLHSHMSPNAFLESISCPPALASAVQNVISLISYSTEMRAPALVESTLRHHPELAIVQDADRLDALGAVGIGRAFTFGGAKGEGGMERTMEHFASKLEKLQGLMKTGEGRRMARERTGRLLLFREWWEGECGGDGDVVG